MPTTLSPNEQLTAASNQLLTWKNQQLAETGIVNGAAYQAQAYSILTSGNYPALELALKDDSSDPLNTIFALPQDISPNDTVITNQTGVGTGQAISTPQTNLTADQYAAALQASPNTNQGAAFDNALSQAYAAQQSREDAPATVTAATTPEPPTPAPTDTVIDSNTAQSSGSGTNTDITSVAPSVGFVNSQNSDITAVAPNAGFNINNSGIAEDIAGGGGTKVATVYNPSPSIYNDQTPTTANNGGVPSNSKPGEDAVTQNSVNVTSSGKATGGSSSSTAGGGVQSSPSTQNSQFPTAKGNILHDYVNYTYKISIYAVPTSNINLTYNSGLTPGNENALIQGGYFVLSDGGIGASTVTDRTYFPTDLGIDNVELETIVANHTRTRGTDVIRIKFEVIEPYTTNFLGKLQQVAIALNGNNANWSNTFFVMVIDFYGYDDIGIPQKIKGTTKYIPFTFTKMKMKITASGGRYTVDAIPVHSIASTLLDNQIPFHVEIQASTIADLFQGTAESYTTTTSGGLDGREPASTVTTQNGPVTGDSTVIKGLTDALNQAEIQKCLPDAGGNRAGQELPNVYNFVFDQSLLSATISEVAKFTEQTTAMTDPGNATTKQQGQTGKLTIDLKAKRFNAQAGTKITDFINSVLSVSSYMLDQNTTSGQDSQTVNTWKITPSVKFGQVDKGTGFYQRTVTYHITPYVMSGHDAPGFGQKTVDPNEIVKQYLYTYSGLNKDVLDVNLEYNAAFFEIRNAKPGNLKQTNSNPGTQSNPADGTYVGAYDASTDNRFFKPKYHYVRGIANRQNTSATTIDDKTIAVQNLMEKLYDNMGDMFKLDITIVGDPDWISQDSTLYGPGIGAQPYIPGTNGSINFMRPAYFNFYFATPNQDYDDTTGLFNSNLTYSQFSGIFQVSAVTSSFNSGKFTQKLKNYRVRNQTATATTPSRNDSANSSSPVSSSSGSPKAEPANNTVIAGNPADKALGITSNVSRATASNPNSGVGEDSGTIH